MSEVLDARSEVIKLARLLGTDREAIAFMEKVDSASLREFRYQLIDAFYGNEDDGLARFAKVGNLLPASAIAALTKEAVGPVLAARIAGMVDPKQASSVVQKLPVSFVADIAVQIDPRRVTPVIGALPPATLSEIAAELVKRKEFVAMGEMVGAADESTLSTVLDKASDAELLQVAFVTEDKDALQTAISMLSDKRLRNIMKVAGKENLWPAALDLLRHMTDEEYLRVIQLASKLDDATLDALVAVSLDDDLWELVIPAVSQMKNPSKVVAALLRAEESVVDEFADAIIADGAWEDVRELLEKLPHEQVVELRKRIASNGRAPKFEPVAELLLAKA